MDNSLLQGDLDTFSSLLSTINENLDSNTGKLDDLKSHIEQLNKEHPVKPTQTNNFQYIDVKSLLLLNYCITLQTYSLRKLEGEDLADHEVFNKLAYLRLILEKLKPLDKKVDYQIEKLLRSAVTQSQGAEIIQTVKKKEDNLRYKPSLTNLDTHNLTEKAQKARQEEVESDEDEGESVEDLSAGEDEQEAQNSESSDIDPDNINSEEIDSDELEKYVANKQKEQVKKEIKRFKEDEDSDAEDKEGKGEKGPELFVANRFNPVLMDEKMSKAQKQKKRDQKRMSRMDLVRELKHDMLGLPEEVNYGIASGNQKLLAEERADEELEQHHFKRIQYTKKELKQREKRRERMNRVDTTTITDGFHDFKVVNDFMNKDYSDDSDERKQFEKQKYLDEVRGRKKGKMTRKQFLNEEIDSDEADGSGLLTTKLKSRSGNKSGGKKKNRKRKHKF